MPSGPGWERQRAALRSDIVATATRLFVAQGYDATTIDQIVAEVGVSRRTFFRYFGTKEDVLLGDLAARGAVIAEELRARPSGEGPWEALRAAFDASRNRTFSDHDADLAIGRILHRVPALAAARAQKRATWRAELVPVLADRIGGPHAALRADAIVSAALSCLDVASAAWIDANGQGDLPALYDEAVAAVTGRPGSAD
jgi:AcrR family transcriptional regulator